MSDTNEVVPLARRGKSIKVIAPVTRLLQWLFEWDRAFRDAARLREMPPERLEDMGIDPWRAAQISAAAARRRK